MSKKTFREIAKDIAPEAFEGASGTQFSGYRGGGPARTSVALPKPLHYQARRLALEINVPFNTLVIIGLDEIVRRAGLRTEVERPRDFDSKIELTSRRPSRYPFGADKPAENG
jgi:hypothetical protein